jgi:hypothetical protein
MAPRTELEKERPKDGLMAALREKYRLIVLLAALAVINLASQHFRSLGLSGKEMLIGTLIFVAALVVYAYVRAVWDVKVRKKPLGIEEGRQDQS